MQNSFQAMGSGTPSSKFTNRQSKDGKKLEIRLTDNGPGIPKKHIKRIFDPFFTTKDTGEGTGFTFIYLLRNCDRIFWQALK